MRRAAGLAAALLLAGCAGTLDVGDATTTGASRPCAHGASFVMPGLYDALENASAGELEHEQWAPTLPYENATLRERWRDFSLVAITRDHGEVDGFPTQVRMTARGEAVEIGGSGEANVTAAQMREHFLAFARDVLVEVDEAWADAFAASRDPSAFREGTPGNATPFGEGPFREYQEGPAYGYSYDVTVNATPRLEALLATMPPLDAWTPVDAETGRMLYRHEGWTLWFEQPRNHLDVDDVRITAFPEGDAYAMVGVLGQDGDEALATLRAAFAKAGLGEPPVTREALHAIPCGD